MTKIFITGATGQVGSHLAEYLVTEMPLGLQHPEEIKCLIRNPDKADFLRRLGVSFAIGDLSDEQLLRRHLEDIDYIFHLAANVYVYSSFEEMYETNVRGTENLLKAFAKSHATLFVHTSSIIVYDAKKYKKTQDRIPVFTETSPWGPMERGKDVPYAVTKRLGEKLVSDYAEKYPQKFFIISRLGPIIGPRDRQMIPALVESLRLPLPKLIGGGKTQLCLTSPEDVARAEVFLAQLFHNHQHNSHNRNKNPSEEIQINKTEILPKIRSGEAFNIANEMVSFKQLFSYVSDYYKCPPPKASIPIWLFKLVKPILKVVKRFFPQNMFIQTFFSPSALEYLEKTYIYSSDKLKSLGFKYRVKIKDSVEKALYELDPKRKLIGKRAKTNQPE